MLVVQLFLRFFRFTKRIYNIGGVVCRSCIVHGFDIQELFDKHEDIKKAANLTEKELAFMRGYVQLGKAYNNFLTGIIKTNDAAVRSEKPSIDAKTEILADAVLRNLITKELAADKAKRHEEPAFKQELDEAEKKDNACLFLQKEAFIYDIFCRLYELFGEACPYSKEAFSVEIYEAGEQVKISVIGLPTKDLQEGNIPKMVLVLDRKHVKFHFLLVRQDAEAQNVYYFDLCTGDWEAEGPAPADTEELLAMILDILDQKPMYPHYLSARCPLCNRSVKLGVTEEEWEKYKRYCDEEIDLEEAIPALNAFEREFLNTGMCPAASAVYL